MADPAEGRRATCGKPISAPLSSPWRHTQSFPYEENSGNLYSAGGEFSRIRRLISLFPGEFSDFLRESPFFVVSRMLLSNSIPLTPGTVTVRQEGEDYLVLCLNKAHAADIPDWSLTRLLRKMEGPEWN